jgi:hypothetical protein
LESNATDSKDSDEYKLDPEEDIEDKSITADSKSESESEDEEVTKPSATIRPSIVTRPSAATKPSSTRPSDATKPSATTKSSTDKEKRATNKRIKDEVLRLMPQFKAELGEPLQSKHWGKLISQMENVDKYTKWLFFDKSNYCKHWRNKLTKAQKIMEIGIIGVKKGGRALGESSANAANSAIEVAKRVTYTHTLRLSDDDADNKVAIGKVISTLEDLRSSVTPIIPAALTDNFAVGNPNKARNLVTSDYDSTMKFATKSYAYETAEGLAAEIVKKNGLSANFPRFNKESYETLTKFTSADEIHRMCKLSIEDLHAEVRAFKDKNCIHLTKDSTE